MQYSTTHSKHFSPQHHPSFHLLYYFYRFFPLLPFLSFLLLFVPPFVRGKGWSTLPLIPLLHSWQLPRIAPILAPNHELLFGPAGHTVRLVFMNNVCMCVCLCACICTLLSLSGVAATWSSKSSSVRTLTNSSPSAAETHRSHIYIIPMGKNEEDWNIYSALTESPVISNQCLLRLRFANTGFSNSCGMVI